MKKRRNHERGCQNGARDNPTLRFASTKRKVVKTASLEEKRANAKKVAARDCVKTYRLVSIFKKNDDWRCYFGRHYERFR